MYVIVVKIVLLRKISLQLLGSLRKVRSVAMDVQFFKIPTLRTPQFAERPYNFCFEKDVTVT